MRPFLSFLPRCRGRLLLTCEHATNRLPESIEPDVAERTILATHWGYDPGAWALTRAIAARLTATAVGGGCSRLWIDLNRAAADPTLIRREVEDVSLSWNRRPSPAETERRIAEWHAPFHAEVERRIVAHVVRGLRPLILAIHTFTPELEGVRRDFEVGVLFRAHSRAARTLVRGCRDAGLATRSNEPYSGLAGMMYSAERHGTHHDLPCLELEVNQGSLTAPGAVARVGSRLARAVAAVL